MRRSASRWLTSLFVVIFGASLFALVAACGPATSAQRFAAQPEPGRYVYDMAGALTAGQAADLEARARTIQQAGTPIIIYLQAKDATYDETVSDSKQLMNQWDVQSKPDARDGFVVFVNLKPGDLRHGQIALTAGETLTQGDVPDYELQRLADEVVLPQLREGNLAGGLAAGLDGLRNDLVSGPPPPPVSRTVARAVGGWPYNAAAALLSVLALVGCAVALRRRPARGAVTPTTTAPGGLAPAYAGALVTGRASDAQVEATLLDLARKGALVIEPAGRRKVQVRLRNAEVVHDPIEREVWAQLQKVAGGDGTIPHARLGKLRSSWRPVARSLRQDLFARGWYDPGMARVRRPLYVAAALTWVVASGGIVLTVIAEQGWALIGSGLLFAAGTVALICALTIGDTSVLGEQEAAPWRAYRAGLKEARKDSTLPLDLDAALPYAVALGVVGAMGPLLKRASGEGYAPSWFVRQPGMGADVGFYGYWIAFHSSVGATSGGGAGGAATGSASAGGSF